MKQSLTAILFIFSISSTSIASDLCTNVLGPNMRALSATVLSDLESIELRVKSINFVSAHSDDIRKAYYHAFSRGVSTDLIESRLGDGLRFLNREPLPPHSAGLHEAYFANVLLGLDPQTVFNRIENGISHYNLGVGLVKGMEGVSVGYHYAVASGVAPSIANNRISNALQYLNRGNHYTGAGAQNGYYIATGLGISSKVVLDRLKTGLAILRLNPSYVRPDGMISAYYTSVALRSHMLLVN